MGKYRERHQPPQHHHIAVHRALRGFPGTVPSVSLHRLTFSHVLTGRELVMGWQVSSLTSFLPSLSLGPCFLPTPRLFFQEVSTVWQQAQLSQCRLFLWVWGPWKSGPCLAAGSWQGEDWSTVATQVALSYAFSVTLNLAGVASTRVGHPSSGLLSGIQHVCSSICCILW